MNEETINVSTFVNDRLDDIKYIETALNNSRKKTMLFQRLKFYKRRRSRSYIKKSKNTRRPQRHILKTHIWYSKRFKMIKVFNCSLPLTRNIKSDKYIYRSLHRGFVFDESFKKTEVYKRNDGHFLTEDVEENILSIKHSKNEQIEVVLMDEYIIVSYIEQVIDRSIFEGLEYVSAFDCTFLIIKANPEMSKEFSFTKPFFVSDGKDRGKIFVSRQQAMIIWQDLIKKSLVPVSLRELERIALEEQAFNYPFDCVQSQYFREYEKILNKEIIDKYQRTPKGKKVKIDVNDLFIFREDVEYFFFEHSKGTSEKNSLIIQGGDVVGRVVRSGFSFTRGRCRGLGFVYKKLSDDIILKCKNLGEEIEHEIKVLKWL